MDVFLVRHGQSEANAGLTDHLDSGLTELGRRQAALTADWLRRVGLTRAFASPLRRTLQTAAPFCVATGLHAEVTATVCEYFSAHNAGYRTFQGLAPDAIRAEFPFAVVGDTFPCEPIWWPQEPENDAIIYARAVRTRDALLSLYAAAAERLLIVSHADTVGRLTEAFLRVPPCPDDPPWSDNCAVTRLRCPADPTYPAELLCQNDTSHLPPALRS